MTAKAPLKPLTIATANHGFYKGFNTRVAIASKIAIGALILWVIFFPRYAGTILNEFNGFILTNFAAWYIWTMAFFLLTCLALAIWPAAGRLKLGLPDDTPEFSNFSWYSMMFGAGVGVGMLTWSVAEPLYHFQSSPETILGLAEPESAGNVMNAFKWSFLDWGLSAWASYSLCGLCLAYFAYRRNLPLTIRSSMTALFGSRLEGGLGHVIDTVAVIATILGVAQTLGFGVEQFVAGLHRIGLGDWLVNEQGTATTAAIIVATLIIVGASTFSALSGVGRGIKWLSNLNMGLSIFLLVFLLIFGSTWFGLTIMGKGILEYLIHLPKMIFTVWPEDGTSTGDALAAWQGAWTVFTFAWWIAFAPFVGLFLARISKGRSVREFIFGTIVVPTLISCFWFAFAGGSAMGLELTGAAQGAVLAASDGAKLFVTTDLILSSIAPFFAWAMAALIVVLLMTYLVTSADSAILIINTISAAGDDSQKPKHHIVFWGVALGLVVGALLLAGGLTAIKTAMVIGALPFSLVMVFMCVSLLRAIFHDTRRAKLEDP